MDSLIAQANADADRDVLLAGLTNQQSTNAANAAARITQNQFPNLFSDVSTLFKKINDTAQFNRGLTANPYGNLFGGSGSGLQSQTSTGQGSTGFIS